MNLNDIEEGESLQRDRQNLTYWDREIREAECKKLKELIREYVKTTVLSDDKADVLYDFLIDYRKKLGL